MLTELFNDLQRCRAPDTAHDVLCTHVVERFAGHQQLNPSFHGFMNPKLEEQDNTNASNEKIYGLFMWDWAS